MGTSIKIEIGDFFKIKKSQHNYKCKSPNKIFQVIEESKSRLSVYYYDNRTNNNCKCYFCYTKSNAKEELKSIGKSDIVLHRKHIQHLREKKLKQILK